MNELNSIPFGPVFAGLGATALTFIPGERGGIRILQAIWFMFVSEHVVVAAGVHGIVVGGVGYAFFWILRRLGYPLAGNVAVALAFLVYIRVLHCRHPDGGVRGRAILLR